MESLRKALRLPHVNLFNADDTVLGKTIEAGLIGRELLQGQDHRGRDAAVGPAWDGGHSQGRKPKVRVWQTKAANIATSSQSSSLSWALICARRPGLSAFAIASARRSAS
jgi:hypothetical protein